MSVLLTGLIVAISAAAPIEGLSLPGTEVFHCDFGPTWDKNFDRWPADWSRDQGRGYPQYLKLEIVQQAHPGGDRCLRFELDGGAAAAYTPPIEINSVNAYLLQGLVKTEGLVHDRAFFSVALLDPNHQPIERFVSEKLGETDGWKRLRLGPWAASERHVRYAVIGLHLEPEEAADLTGSACFADIRVARLPRMGMSLGSVDHVFTTTEPIEVRCDVAGFPKEGFAVNFELLDERNQPIAKARQKLTVRTDPSDELEDRDGVSKQVPALDGFTAWKVPVPGSGFYRVRASAYDGAALLEQQEATLAVVKAQDGTMQGPFGWSVPRGGEPLPLSELERLLGRVGINWVKYPLWYGRQTGPADIERLVAFSERLNMQGIGLVGLLNDPPPEVREHFANRKRLLAAEVFSAATDVWYPSLMPVLERLATRVQWWQLSDDTDVSFIGYPELARKIAALRQQLEEVGQTINVGLAWNWTDPVPQSSSPTAPWCFVNLSTNEPLTAAEIAGYLQSTPASGVERWVALAPLPKGEFPTDARIMDLVQRMMAAKIHGAQRIFATDPFDPQTGLMNDDGTPGELLMPWRTTALALSNRHHLGRIRMPQGSLNEVFADANDAVIVVWNERPVREVLFLGDDVRQVDLWGRSRQPETEGHRQVIEVGPLPTLLVGCNSAIARWRITFAFQKKQIPSIPGQEMDDGLELTNGFPYDIEGTAELAMPEGWSAAPARIPLRLAAKESQTVPFQVMVRDANNGVHPVRTDFEIRAEKTFRFSVYDQMDLGLGDVYITVSSRMNDGGELIVEQQFVNETDEKVSFRCQLFIPNRCRMATQVMQLDRGTDAQTYHLANGEELVGQTLWLRAIEIDGPRILNYRFVVK